LTSELQAQAANSIDTDSRRLGRLSPTSPSSAARCLRAFQHAGLPSAGTAGVDELAPSPLLQSLSSVRNGVVTHSGYAFQLWLPANPAPGPIVGLAEDANGGKTVAPFPDAGSSEQYFCCYAWPMNAGITGLRCFVVNQEGVIMETSMRGPGSYSGLGSAPNFDAAYTVAGDMSSHLARNGVGVDGHNWVAVQ
jgi:hypothetical protein